MPARLEGPAQPALTAVDRMWRACWRAHMRAMIWYISNKGGVLDPHGTAARAASVERAEKLVAVANTAFSPVGLLLGLGIAKDTATVCLLELATST